jgi:hypothetical protein
MEELMGTTIKFLIISAAIVIPWGVIRLANLEMKARDILEYTGISDLGIIAFLIIPPVTWFVTKWLFAPRGRQIKRYSASKTITMKFRG